jgi:hypothetical protein
MDLADASPVVAAESLALGKISTIEPRDFGTYRIERGHRYRAFEVVG